MIWYIIDNNNNAITSSPYQSEKAAKRMATMSGYNTIGVGRSGWLECFITHKKTSNKWQKVTN